MKTPLQIFRSYPGPRDAVFADLLKSFQHPTKIVQVGGVQIFRADYRVHSGWSDGFFIQHLARFGGKLSIIDVNKDALENSEALINEMLEALKPQVDIDIDYILSTGEAFLQSKNNYDLAYLDGSDDPDQMVEQFNALDRERTSVLCDDWSIKGTKLATLVPPGSFIHFPAENGMAFFPSKTLQEAWRKLKAAKTNETHSN